MVVFDPAKFLSDIRDVDKDLREMALFDLQQALREPGFHLSESDGDMVLEMVLRCFTKDEPDREVRNNAIQVAPRLFFVCSERQQIRLFSFLCAAATLRGTEFGDRGSSELLESSAFAVGLCSEAVAEKARLNVDVWQRLLPVAHRINTTLLAKLNDKNVDICRGGMYDAMIALIVPFARTYPCEVRDDIAKMALLDFSGTGSTCRCVIACLSLLSPFLSEAAFNDVRQTAIRGLQRADPSARLLPHLHLYDALVKHSPLRMMTDVCAVMRVLLTEMRRRMNEYASDDDDICDALMRVMNSMVCQYPSDLSALHGDIFDCCISLMRFDPNYCADAEDEVEAETETEDTYADYYLELEEVDMSWKLRMWAAKLLSSLIQVSPTAEALIRRLCKADFAAVNDRVEEVQLANLHLVNAIAQQPCGGEVPSIFLEVVEPLLTCVCGSSQKVSITAIKSLQLMFELHGAALIQIGEAVCRVVSELVVRDTNGTSLFNSEVITLSQCVMDATLLEPKKAFMAAKLFDTIFYMISKGQLDNVSDRALRMLRIMTRVALTTGASCTDRCVTLCFFLLETKLTDVEVSQAATTAIGRCLSSLLETLPTDAVCDILQRLILLAETNWNALEVLGSVLGNSTAIRVPADLLERIVKYTIKCPRPQQHVIFGVVRDTLRNGSELTSEALHHVMQMVERDTFTSKNVVLLEVALELLTEVCKKYPHVIEQMLSVILAGVWSVLETVITPAAPLQTRVVANTVTFFHAICLQLPQHRPALLEAVLRRTVASASPDIYSELLGGIVLDNGELLDQISSCCAQNEDMVCLCVGTTGCSQPLPDTWRARLVENFVSAGSEAARRLALLSISRAAVNPQNISLVTQVVECAVTGQKDRSLYWRLLREMTSTAASQVVSSFSEHTFCKLVMERLLENVLEDDVETSAAVLGSFLSFDLMDLIDITRRCLNSDSELVKATCISTQRYVISHCKSEDINPQLTGVIEESLRHLRRTSSVYVRLSALQLFASVASSQPQLLLTPTMRDVVYPNVLAELVEDLSLVLTVNLGGYTHRDDKGIEVRRLAFESIAILLRETGRQRRGTVLEFFARFEELLQCLVHACGPQEKGETDVGLNNQAKTLLVRLVKTYPNLPWSDALLTSLHAKLKAVLETNSKTTAADAEKARVNMMYTLSCVMRLTECVPFAYLPQFQPLLLMAQGSPLLTESMRLVL
ncbi:hypothetical protein TraAM80_02592 [Trypanosoma rangeli]|uniref:TATA-binding protein interacting (TIP20) domain-containing protein n=1 Tax=Trypanosoma rangeli TaxID=5698 RepID=A0A3R7MVM0_TRYRA|nr:uncharacterized protein TraAM80_02592 [Trypanosoma rangeli]RNF08749.1 hypothetical protein TraAM80_02592 [Trypanosoma rangeli]|eukprot:RNF08749.1 hypothetical protein TraAM80_02592 [Trypanosoma rangeli]